MATRWDAQQADLLADWQKQDEANLRERDDKLKGIDAKRDQGVAAADAKHEARLRELSPESELYAGQKELADKAHDEEIKGINATHAKETMRVNEDFDQKHEANSRMRESLQVRTEGEPAARADADFPDRPVPPEPPRQEGPARVEAEAEAAGEDDAQRRR